MQIDDRFNLKDWEWIAVHSPPSERENMAKVAWLICCKCTPREIARCNIDPKIVVPLCGIVLLDEINILQLKKLKTKLSDCSHKIFERCEISEELKIKQEHINEIKEANEAFITSATQYVMPVVSVDNFKIGNGKVGK